MTRAIGKAIMVLALCLSIGLHWLALQSIAWTTMLVTNVSRGPLTEAVSKTFDGQHPCGLCRAVAAGSKSQKKGELLPTTAKFDLICNPVRLAYLPPWTSYSYASDSFTAVKRSLAPPAPPPRSLLS